MTRRVLIITAGGTPQVVTETLYALARPASGESPWWPEELVLVTTLYGDTLYRSGDRERGVVPLLGARGKLAELSAEIGRPLPDVRVLVARHRSSDLGIADIRTPDEVSAFADDLLDEVRRQTSADTEVHLSLAGGRKTMSYLAGAILSLYGRPQDRLSHVLIEPKGLEEVPEFWWPEQVNPADGFDAKSRRWRAAGARALLHTVPFVRLRAHVELDEIFGAREPSFAEAVDLANKALTPGILRVDTPSMSISAGGGRVVIAEARQFAVYRFFAEARRDGWTVGGGDRGAMRFADIVFEKTPGGQPLLDRLGEIVRDVWLRGKKADSFRGDAERLSFSDLSPRSKRSAGEETAEATPTELIERRIGPHISDLKRILKKGLPQAAAKRAAPAGRGRVMIPWEPDRIEID